jgi:hypothetical protein
MFYFSAAKVEWPSPDPFSFSKRGLKEGDEATSGKGFGMAH